MGMRLRPEAPKAAAKARSGVYAVWCEEYREAFGEAWTVSGADHRAMRRLSEAHADDEVVRGACRAYLREETSSRGVWPHGDPVSPSKCCKQLSGWMNTAQRPLRVVQGGMTSLERVRDLMKRTQAAAGGAL